MSKILPMQSDLRIITSKYNGQKGVGLYPMRYNANKMNRTPLGMQYYAEVLNGIAIAGNSESTVDIIVNEDLEIKAVYIDKLNAIFDLEVLGWLIRDSALVLIGAEDNLGFRQRFNYASKNIDLIEGWLENAKLDGSVLSVELNFGNAEKALQAQYGLKAYDRPNRLPELFR